MIVKFDLRPAALIKKEVKRRSFNLLGLVMTILIIAFAGSSGFYLVDMTMRLLSLRDEVYFLYNQVEDLEINRRALEAEIARLRNREKTFADTLKIMQDEIPTIEVLGVVENNINYGMGLTRLQFTQRASVSSAVMNATAATTDQVVSFREGLVNSGVFPSTSMPTLQYNEPTKQWSFTLNLPVNSIGQIGQNSSAQK
ncbi:hypothetical protein FACS1894204_08390 [Synergistales bacterium]|nr:hypothetical protein FACS1894204_08390 [Synergistales bacterium]